MLDTFTRSITFSRNGPPTTKPPDEAETPNEAESVDGAEGVDRGPSGRPLRTLRAADPSNRTRRDTSPAGAVFAVMTATLISSTLLNAQAMLHRAEVSELGFTRTIAVGFWSPIESFSSTIGLTLPRAGLDALRDADRTGSKPSETIADFALSGPEPRNRALSRRRLPETDPAGPESAAGSQGVTGAGTTPSSTAGPDGKRPVVAVPPTRSAGEDDVAAAPVPQASDEGEAPFGLPRPPGADDGLSGGDGEDDSLFALRRPTPEDPLRILIVGDSTLDAVGTSMLRDLAATGVTDAVLDFRVSSGLSRPDFFDWPGRIRELQPGLSPELVVVMLGANDAQPVVVDSEVEAFGTDAWLAAYRAKVAGLLEEQTAQSTWVIWIGQPVMRSHDFNDKMAKLNEIYSSEAERFPTASFLDARPLTVDDNGEYSAYLIDAAGNRNQVRRTDGVHFTPAGGDHLAPAVIDAINELAPLY